MEGVPMVCYSTGTINSLLDKLTKLKNHSNPADGFSLLTDNLKEDLLDLRKDFSDKVAVPKLCFKQARELVFEIEDWIDQKPETNMLDPSDEQKVEYFKAKIDRARERFTWYYNLLKVETTEFDSPPSKITINPRQPVEEKPCHGVLDGPRDKLVKYLTDDKEEMLKVVSVVGVEGLGKTTLAKEIYSELQLRGLFECQAIVSVTRGIPMKKILNDILRQVNPKKFSEYSDLQRIITELREYLGMKRYFILFDGIWSTWAWKIINCALPNNRGSRVLITTCTVDIGNSCSCYPNDLVYQMDALRVENSRTLFCSRIINLEEEEKGADFEEACGYMLSMCGGMPLAIIVAAGLLARKSGELAELRMLGNCIVSSLKQYSTSEGMTKILQMSYADLSLPLRSCFLYLSVFPENCTISKERLIWLWGAEGFIPRRDTECLWVTGERYFHELISRRLIQPVFTCDDDQAVGCTIHGVILDFIRSLSREENFATTAEELNSGALPCDTIRRFSLNFSNREEDEAETLSTRSVHLSSMRSLIVIGDSEQVLARPVMTVFMNIVVAFKLLRVLDLEDTRYLEVRHLEGIGGLVLLKYLGLAGAGITRLPEDIGKLEQLETLDLPRNVSITLPKSRVKLQKVTHLLLEVDAAKIWEMPGLEVASNISARSSSSLAMVVELLNKSEALRILGVTLDSLSFQTETVLVTFLDEVVKSKLQSLSLNCELLQDEQISLLVDSWEKVTAPLGKKFEPQRFEIKASGSTFRRVPPNMGSVASLTHLDIHLYQAKAEDFHVLGGFTKLVFLNLMAFKCPAGDRFVIRKGIFPCLKVFSFRIEDSWMGIEFEEGAMPQLQRLGLTFRASERGDREYQDLGIDHLTCLTSVHVTISCESATVLQVEAAEAAIRAQISEPMLQLRRKYERLIEQDEVQQSLVIPIRRPDVEDEGQHSLPITPRRQVSKKTDKHKMKSIIASEDKPKKGGGKHSIPSKKHVSDKTDKNKFDLRAVSEGKMKKDEEI